MYWACRGPASALQLSSQWGLDSAQDGNPCLLLHAGVEAACHLLPEQQCPPLAPLLARFGGSLIPRETVRVGQDAGLGRQGGMVDSTVCIRTLIRRLWD